MKVAIIHTPLVNPTGGERQVLCLAIYLQKRGHDVEIFTNRVDNRKCFPDLLSKVKVNVIPCSLPSGIGYYGQLSCMLRLGKSIQRGFDIINNHNFPTEWAAYFAKKKIHTPVIWMCNEPPFWFFLQEARRKLISKLNWPLFEVLDKISVRSIDGIVVLSKLMGEIVKKIYSKEYTIIRSGVDVNRFGNIPNRYPKSFREEHKLENSFVLLQVGTLTYYKRQEDSIKALNLVLRKHENIKLIFVGVEDINYKAKLINLIKKYKIENNVLFLGSVSDRKLEQVYAACDVFLFPAFQSWSLVTIEAMAAKKPVIVSNMCGVSEIITSGYNGFVVSHKDYKMMANFIDLLYKDRRLKERIGKNAYNFVKKNMSWRKYGENMEKIFNEVVK